MLYLDTSALAKRYVIEPGSSALEGALEENDGRLFSSAVTYAELLAILARCLRERRLSEQAYRRQKKTFLADWDSLHIVQVTPDVLRPAPAMIERHGLRGFDAIHLCSALWVGTPLFACFDEPLRKAAAAQGLRLVPEGD
jgi:uncharacterized protein